MEIWSPYYVPMSFLICLDKHVCLTNRSAAPHIFHHFQNDTPVFASLINYNPNTQTTLANNVSHSTRTVGYCLHVGSVYLREEEKQHTCWRIYSSFHFIYIFEFRARRTDTMWDYARRDTTNCGLVPNNRLLKSENVCLWAGHLLTYKTLNPH